ncbi:hypothetical protein HPP92_009087 [Vanilla planifolia]|uniref:Uncharacterized protein n=1 Tax=Vanilla planifolia TaxID=51239 RepID=A0A835R787_VANPL|nr:hypothetical protein HPP92_009087 [Vanilla planifolia]
MASPQKRRKIASARSGIVCVEENLSRPPWPADKEAKPSQACLIPVADAGKIDANIQLAKKQAIDEALRDGCLGNFRSFDSQFGNFLLPVIPTEADLRP